MSGHAMPMAALYSLLFHIAIVGVGVVGFPYIRKPILPPEPISVEIVEIDALTQTNKRSAAPKPIEDIKKPEPVEDKPPAPPKVETLTPPQVIPPQPPKPVEKKIVKPKDTPPPPDKVKPKEPEKKKEEVAEVQEEQFLSLLKNLQDGAPQDASQEQADSAEKAPPGQLGDRITQSELDAMQAALNQQFAYCWNLSAGAKYAEDIVIQIRLLINPDRTVKDVRIVDQLRYSADSYFRAAADNVIRAVRHPSCQILDLPPDRFEFWKDSVFNFNPSQML